MFAHALAGLALASALAPLVLAQSPLVQHAFLKAHNADANDQFGAALAFDGGVLAVGAPFEDGDGTSPTNNSEPQSGVVHLYRRVGLGWQPLGSVKAPQPQAGAQFGAAVALDGATLVVGAPGDDVAGIDSGAAYVYRFNGFSWLFDGQLQPTHPGAEDAFGAAVAIDADRILVGAPFEDSHAASSAGAENATPDAGAAYLFTRTLGAWQQSAFLKASNAEANDIFGSAVDISGPRLVVGAPHEDGKLGGTNVNQLNNMMFAAGAAYAFELQPWGWTQTAYVKPVNPMFSGRFGTSVALDGDRLAVSAPYESSRATGIGGNPFDTSAPSSGAVYLFRDSTALGWLATDYVKATNTQPNDRFGAALALHDGVLLVGAPEESSNATGMGGNIFNNAKPDAGAVYRLELEVSTWSHTHYIKASNTDVSDAFGTALAVDGGVLVVGAPEEDSSGEGVNAPQENDQRSNAGAVYAFDVAPQGCGSTEYGGVAGANVARLTSTVVGTLTQPAQVRASELPNNSPALLVLSAHPAALPFAGGMLFVDPAHQLPVPGAAFVIQCKGKGFELNPAPSAALVGFSVYLQALQAAPTLPQGVALTNGLELTLCP